jgi:hypothetical protein
LAIIVAAPSCLVHVVAPGRCIIVIGLWGTFFSVAFLIAGALGLPLLATFDLSGLFAADELDAAALALAVALFIPADPPRPPRASEAARRDRRPCRRLCRPALGDPRPLLPLLHRHVSGVTDADA